MSTILFSIDELTQERIDTLSSLVKAYSHNEVYLSIHYPSIPVAYLALPNIANKEQEAIERAEALLKELSSRLHIKPSHCSLTKSNTFFIAICTQSNKLTQSQLSCSSYSKSRVKNHAQWMAA